MSERSATKENAECVDMEIPEFERILDEIGSLVNRLKCVRETYVSISDALIGVQSTGNTHDDSAKPSAPNYFVIRCFDMLGDCKEEVEMLERVNAKLFRSVTVE